ncbi:DUF1697 domain-containing protein [Nocardioides alcanivorans]|uniref:DUF1697 domain-containing protein n=1 Tax=Nocardioides alcanivorans TaxID=2897352 RepID=UPI001F36800B|nr:DUF1697 domain-containing protein [Nocardioides alcanivorans]
MATRLAFLRAINLGAKRKFPKDDIRASVEGAGFTDVATYINTGNVRFETRMRSRARIEATLEQAFRADRGFEVPTIVFTRSEFARIGTDSEELHEDHLARHYVWLLKEELDDALREQVEGLSTEHHRVIVRGGPPISSSGRGTSRERSIRCARSDSSAWSPTATTTW